MLGFPCDFPARPGSPPARARRRSPRRSIPLAALLLASCALPSFGPLAGGGVAVDAERLAATVTIHRDSFGVPHIHGRTDAAVAFGIGYAQAEDNLWRIEEDYLHALGWAAYLHGEAMLGHDIVRAAFDVERLAREEYDAQPPELRRLFDSYAAGLNYYVRMHPQARPRVIVHFEPWYPLALVRTASPDTRVDGVRLGELVALVGVSEPAGDREAGAGSGGAGAGGAGAERAGAAGTDASAADPSSGSATAWAIAPARSAAGRALLFQQPDAAFFGAGQLYELRLESDDGWRFAGAAVLGTPFPRVGHNEHLGWTHTPSGADAADAYLIDFSHPTDPLMYRHGDEWRSATEHVITVRVNTQQGVVPRAFRIVRTHHGPIVANRDGRPVAVRLARFEEGGSLAQWYAMGRARSLDEFRDALARRALPAVNTMYADAAGNIAYVHGSAVPRRDARFDWHEPVDGADPATDWQGFHELDELPQLLNPPGGWLQNTGGTPFLAAADGSNIDAAAYPAYMAPEGDNARASRSRRILAAESTWTLDLLAEAAFDTYAGEADAFVAGLVDEWERLGVFEPERALRIEGALDGLREWDRNVTVESTAATHFLLAFERFVRAGSHAGDDVPRVRALEFALAALAAEWGTTDVAWGERNRLQRVHTRSREGFRDYAPSLPIAGAPGRAGVIFGFHTSTEPGQRRRYGTSGHGWLAITRFGDRPESRSIVPFGQSADPASPHYFDQAPHYADGRFKGVHFGADAFEAAAVHSYRPGARLPADAVASPPAESPGGRDP